MSKKYIIGIRNSEPAPPEIEYYCGISQRGNKMSTDEIRQDKNSNNFIWVADPSAAAKLTTMDGVVEICQLLIDIGFEPDLLRVYEARMEYTPVDVEDLQHHIKVHKVTNIMDKLSHKEKDYLKQLGVLDLTNVT